MSSWWHDVTHVGSYVKSKIKKSKTIYTATLHSVAEAVDDAVDAVEGAASDLTGSSGSFLDDVEHATQFIMTKANGVVKHYMDSDGDGLFNKKVDQLIAKAKVPAGDLFTDVSDEAHGILGNHGTMYVHGLQHLAEDAYSDYKSHLGGIESAISNELSLGWWDSLIPGITTITSGPSIGVESGSTHVGF